MHQDEQPVRRRYIGKQRPRPSEVARVCQPLAAQQLKPVQSSLPLAAKPHQPKKKKKPRETKTRGVTRVRVQFAGKRLACSKAMCRALRARLQQERASRQSWTEKQWGQVVAQVALEDWGARQHGGQRDGAGR